VAILLIQQSNLKMGDIVSRVEIIQVVEAFYKKVRADETIGFIFNDIAKVDWEQHMPIMYDFWESTVFGTGTYTRNAMTPHFILQDKVKFTDAHFETWILHFNNTVDELFEGEHATLMKMRAAGIAGLMKGKLIVQ